MRIHAGLVDDGTSVLGIAKHDPIGDRCNRRAWPACCEIGLPEIANDLALESLSDWRGIQQLPGDWRLVKDGLAVQSDQPGTFSTRQCMTGIKSAEVMV